MSVNRDELRLEHGATLLALDGLQQSSHELLKDFQRKVFEFEKEYLSRCQLLYDRRASLIAGQSSPTNDEVERGVSARLNSNVSEKNDPHFIEVPSNLIPASVKGFWLRVLKNHKQINEQITPRDEGALKHLKDIRLSYDIIRASCGSFMLEFDFEDNEYFDAKVLTRKYFFNDEMSPTGGFEFSHSEGCMIPWKWQKDLTKDIEVRKQRNRITNRTRVIRNEGRTSSFFNFFDQPAHSRREDDEELLYFGEEIKDKIIPRAIDFYRDKAKDWDIKNFDDYLDSDEDELLDENNHGESGSDFSEEWDAPPYPVPKVGRNRPAGCTHQPIDPGCQQQ